MNQPLPILNDNQLGAGHDREPGGFGALRTSRGCLPLASLDVRAKVVGLTSETHVEQTFVNTSREPIEATYIFPLPDRAAVTAFQMRIGERVIDGVLQERAEARRAYDEAIRAGHRAGIAEENRPDVFSLRVGNLMPGDRICANLTLVGPLEYADGQTTFRFPLVVSPRYIPGTPLPGQPVGPGVADDTDLVPDASQVSPPVLLPGFPNPVRLSLAVEIDPAGLPIADLAASLHTIETAEKAGCRVVRLVPGERLNRDFILRWTVAEKSIKSHLILAPDAHGEQGTFQLTLVPPAAATEHQTPRDVVLVLDRSGSMQGWKLVAARRAAARIVDSLAAADRFAVLAFDSVIDSPQGGSELSLVDASDRNRFRAVEFLSRLEARGGTELAAPLVAATKALAQSDPARNRVLVLVTDGQVSGEDHILASLGSAVRELRIFTIGIDQAVNAGLLRRLAAMGGGACDLVESEDRLDAVMDKIHHRISAPLLTGVRLEAPLLGIDESSVTPARAPDLHPGVPLVLMGRYRSKSDKAADSISIAARDSRGEDWTTSIRATPSVSGAIASQWARGHIRDLEDRYAAGSSDLDSLEKRIVAVSLAHQVLSRFTAFVAVDRSSVVNTDGNQMQIVQPVELPSGWERHGSERFCAYSADAVRFRTMDVAPMLAGGAHRVSDSASLAMRERMPDFCLFEASLGESERELDLTSYKGSVAQWLAAMAAVSTGDVAAQSRLLRELVSDLRDLLAALVGVGAAADVLRPLASLFENLRGQLQRDASNPEEVARLWQEALRVLGEFSGEFSAARLAFWKK